MTVPPGWYQDPEGAPGQARYWDGRAWGPSMAQGGSPSSGGSGGWLALVIAVAVALVVALAWVGIPRLLGGDEPADPTPTPTQTEEVPTTEPTESNPEETPGSGEVGELNCAGARSTNFPKGPEFRVAGIVVPFPSEDWGFRFDASQWTWINDLYAWGDLIDGKEGWAAGVVAGRLEAANGFAQPQAAAAGVVECLFTYGPFNDGEQFTEVSSAARTVDGMPGWEMRLTQPQEGQYGSWEIRVMVMDAGQPDNLALAMGFYPTGHESGQRVEGALDAVKRQ